MKSNSSNLYILIILFFLIASANAFAQEICNNGIDDDGDGLIDLNDSAECFCSNTSSIASVFVNNSVCQGGFVSLGTDIIDGIDYDWYRDGIAQIAEEDPIYFVPAPYDGTYVCIITTATGCLITNPVDVLVDDYEIFIQDTLCTDDVYEFNNQNITAGGNYTAFLEAINGCDSIIHLDLFERDCGDTLLVEGKFLNNLIRAGVDTNDDGKIQIAEAMVTDTLDINYDDSLSQFVYKMSGFPLRINDFPNLTYLDISGHGFSNGTLRIDSLVNLRYLDISDTFIEIDDDLVEQPALEYLNIGGVRSTEVDFSANAEIQVFLCDRCRIRHYDFSGMLGLEELHIEPVSDQDTILNLVNNTELRKLTIRSFAIRHVDFSPLSELEYLSIGQTDLAQLDLSQNNNLQTLKLVVMELEELDLSFHPLLKHLDLFINDLTSVDFSVCPLLEFCNLERNDFQEMDFTQNPELRKLITRWNFDVTTLDLTQNHKLEYFDFSSMPFSNDSIMDLSNCFVLDTLIAGRAKFLNLKNGSIESHLDLQLSGNGHDFICIDEDQYELAQTQVSPNANIGSYCDFYPGLFENTIIGSVTFDMDSNCTDTLLGVEIPIINFSIEDVISESHVILNQENGYELDVTDGLVTITPVLVNQELFNITPEFLAQEFPQVSNPYEQDFCISPIQNSKDLATHIIPIGNANSGFESVYQLLLENVGSTLESGQLSFEYDSNVMTYLNSDVEPSLVEDGKLTWTYTDLAPFQTLSFSPTFMLNGPTDTPSLNIGDVLSFSLAADPLNDINEFDNLTILTQEILNSYDPNNKTCLEGDLIFIESIGEYVHYRIQFENLGTANARQVVIQDTINTTMFEIETLVPLSSSHNYMVRIRNENIVEFIFEDIDLPFEVGQNTGYIAFKIKTAQSLDEGDQLINDANIFFDFNFAIQTDEYITDIAEIVSTLSLNNKLSKIDLVPNPVQRFLNIESELPLEHYAIYDLRGALLDSGTLKNSMIDVQNLEQGMYFVRLFTADSNQNWSLKFIKL